MLFKSELSKDLYSCYGHGSKPCLYSSGHENFGPCLMSQLNFQMPLSVVRVLLVRLKFVLLSFLDVVLLKLLERG